MLSLNECFRFSLFVLFHATTILWFINFVFGPD